MKHKIISIAIITVLAWSLWGSLPAQAAPTATCNSNGTGNWGNAGTWACGRVPISGTDTAVILSGHTVTVAANATIDTVTINAGGTVVVNSGMTWTIINGTAVNDVTVNGTLTVSGIINNAGAITRNTGGTITFGAGSTYQHNQNGGVIPTATWNATSTVLVSGIANTDIAGGDNQVFGNLTWSSAGMTGNRRFLTAGASIAGNLQIDNTGSGQLRIRMTPLNIGGSLIQTGGYFSVGSNLPFA